MTTFVIFLGLAAASSLEPDWQNHPKSGWLQVFTLALGMLVLLAYAYLP